MAANIRQRHKPASLTVQIRLAEQQVRDRRRLVGVRATVLGQNMRSKLTSPAVLLLAGGVGFVAGHFTKRKASKASNTKRPRGSHNKLFGRVLKLIILARALSGAFPSAVMDPRVQSRRLPSQAPALQFRSVHHPEITTDPTRR
jgi:hypothetical protein